MLKLASSCSLLSFVLVAGAALIGCGSAEESVDQTSQLLATDGAEAVTSNDQATSSLTDSAFDAVASVDPAAAANEVVAAPDEAIDGKCRSRAKDPSDPNTVIITLTDCRGRFRGRSVSGTERVKFSAGDNGALRADFTSENLTIDGKPATHTATADITIDSGVRRIAWQGGFNTINEKGDAVVHTSDLTIDVDIATRCRTRSGSSETTIVDRQLSTTFEALRVCRRADGDGSCPTGRVIHTRQPSGRSVTVDFDGTARATATGANGFTLELQLACGE